MFALSVRRAIVCVGDREVRIGRDTHADSPLIGMKGDN